MCSLCWEKFHEVQWYSLSVDTVLQLPFYLLVLIQLQTKTKNIRNDTNLGQLSYTLLMLPFSAFKSPMTGALTGLKGPACKI